MRKIAKTNENRTCMYAGYQDRRDVTRKTTGIGKKPGARWNAGRKLTGRRRKTKRTRNRFADERQEYDIGEKRIESGKKQKMEEGRNRKAAAVEEEGQES